MHPLPSGLTETGPRWTVLLSECDSTKASRGRPVFAGEAEVLGSGLWLAGTLGCISCSAGGDVFRAPLASAWSCCLVRVSLAVEADLPYPQLC